jgi:DNA-binding FadR family transcriptional regulator
VKSYELEPRYSTNEVPGRCIKCLGEHELNNCLMQMLRDEDIDKETQRKYEALVDFLRSPESERLRIESERYLAEGKKVTVTIGTENGKPVYRLKVE